MKNLKKVVIAVLCMAAIAGSAFAFTACGSSTKTYDGEYKYTKTYGTSSTTYGFKVQVEVDGDTIKKVTLVDCDYVKATDMTTDTWTPTKWTDNEAKIVKAYEGKSVQTVLGYTVVTSEDVPVAQDSSDFQAYDTDLLQTGATQSSGRLLLAVQNALQSLKK
jgi:hypothetical protein